LANILGHDESQNSGERLVRPGEAAPQGFEIEAGMVVACNGIGYKGLLQAGRQWLEHHIDIVNGLNVFPVPDGDTGTNMWLTLQAASEWMEQTADQGVGPLAQAAAEGALRGARGNSGVILSQFLQGMANSLTGKVIFTAREFGLALQLGVERAYQSVIKPVEGTILTVAAAAAAAAQQSDRSSNDLRAVVCDGGGQGLVYFLEGGLRFMLHEPLDPGSVTDTAPRLKSTLGADYESYGYDVQFLIHGNDLQVAQIRAGLAGLGWSTMVVGDERLIKVHLHTSDPEASLRYGAGYGAVSDVVVENMDQQARLFGYSHALTNLAGLPGGPNSNGSGVKIGTVVVAPGDGLACICQSLGSSQELLAAVDQIKAADVLILPNNGNVILAAQQAAQLSGKRVKVIPTKTVPQGIAALLSFNDQADLETNFHRMVEAAQQVKTIEITRSVRPVLVNGLEIRPGDVIGLLDNQLLSCGPAADETALDILAKLDVDPYEICTIYFGRDSSWKQARNLAGKIQGCYASLAVEIYDGGQPHYDYIISLE
jgi:dihydroxyacetone kinase-like predicted kinase